jgi:hypothetical protein
VITSFTYVHGASRWVVVVAVMAAVLVVVAAVMVVVAAVVVVVVMVGVGSGGGGDGSGGRSVVNQSAIYSADIKEGSPGRKKLLRKEVQEGRKELPRNE